MTTEQVMSTAKDLVNDTINGATTKLTEMSGNRDQQKSNGCDKRSLFCLLFDPCTYQSIRSVRVGSFQQETIFKVVFFYCLRHCS